jgi:Flp pilus assembly secretin CpaC
MNKPTLSVALSVSLALAQAGWQVAQSRSGAIWQQMSGTTTAAPTQPVKKNAVKSKAKVASKNAVVAKATKPSPAVSHNIEESHALLFLSGKDKSANAIGGGPAPAAALSIHPSLPTNVETSPLAAAEPASTNPSVDVASEIPIDESLKSIESATSRSNDLLAQFTADNVVAQGTDVGIPASPIPPVVTGTVDFEEFKPTNSIDLKVSRSRTFKLRNKVVRTSISDPGVAEPVIVAENQMVLLGKSPGRATLVLWDDAGNSSAIDLRVSRDYTGLQSTLREIDPRIIVKTYSVGGSDRLILLGDVDHVESVIRAFAAANVYMDDRGMNIQISNNRIIGGRIGETGASGGGGGGGAGQAGQLAQLNTVDRYTFFPNYNNNVSLAQGICSDGGRVTSLVKVRKVPLIALHVTFMEMNTNAARSLGATLGLNFSGGGFGFGIGGGGSQAGFVTPGTYLTSFDGARQTLPTQLGGGTSYGSPAAFSTAPVSFFDPTALSAQLLGIGQPVFAQASQLLSQQVLLGAPGGASFAPGGLGNLFNSVSNFAVAQRYRFSINPRIVGTIAQNRARILAEPTLVTISGERASFLAGGEIPILQAIATAGQNQFAVTFEPFGMRINMIPVLMENGSINLEIAPEERLISNTFAFNFPGSSSSIPGFTTRKAQTIVEMKPGQELFIGGLISTNNGRELNKYPIFGEIPVIGAMWRSKAWNKNESELVVSVRPEIILPGTPGQLKLPEEIGRVEGPRDMNMFQVEPTVIDERHHTSGRAERHQKTSPTLPEGAPIPDSR